MKILYIIDRPNLYGSEQHLLDIIKNFDQFYDVTIITFSKGEMLDYIPKNTKIKIVKVQWINKFKKYKLLYNMIKKLNPEIIHCHQPKALLYGSVIGRILGVKTIVTIHSKAYDHALIHKGVIRRSFVFIFHTIADFISKLFAKKIIYVNKKMYLNSIFKKKSFFISNWLKSSNQPVKKAKSYLSGNEIRFLTVGSTTKSKGFDLLVSFLRILKKNGIKFNAKVYGHIDESFIKKLSIPEELKLCGFNANLKNAYKEADIFILLSRSETFGLSYLEAMSQGLPIICLDLDDLSELIPSGNIKINTISKEIIPLLNDLLLKNYNDVSIKNISQSKNYSYLEKMTQLKEIYEKD